MVTNEEFGSLIAEYEGFRDTILDEMANLREEIENIKEEIKDLHRTLKSDGGAGVSQVSGSL
jgi:archaellum component FlaC